jgi:transcriptional regulator GlxA family with amidase domain
MEMLAAADALASSQQRRRQRLLIEIAGINDAATTITGGLKVLADRSFNTIEHSDLVIVPALWRNPKRSMAKVPELLTWLTQMAAQGATICAVGTGSCWLAEAGLLNHKAATTHWHFISQFQALYPEVDLKPQYLITQAGNLYCAGSVNSLADLMVHLIGKHWGQDIAHQVESQFSPEIRRPFAEHAYAENSTHLHHDELIIEAQAIIRQRYDRPLSFSTLVKELGLSSRSFNRRFKQAVGTTPQNYLLDYRVNRARELLRTSNLSIAEIAERSGFSDHSYFSGRFKQQMGLSPLAYRKSARGKLFRLE